MCSLSYVIVSYTSCSLIRACACSCYSQILSYLMGWCASYVSHGGNESSMKLSSGAPKGLETRQVASTDDNADMYIDYSNRYFRGCMF